MPEKLPPHFIDLIRDALLKSFWRKPALIAFLRRMRIAEPTLAALRPEETKRVWLDRLFPLLEAHAKGTAVLNNMATALADQTTFPDLARWEDSAQKIKAAEESVVALKAYVSRKKKEVQEEEEAAERRMAGKETQKQVQRSHSDLEALRLRLDQLSMQIGTPQAGYAFQVWYYDLMDYFDVVNRRPYIVDGRQIEVRFQLMERPTSLS